MNYYDAWNKALENTEIIRSRVQSLQTFQQTAVPYVLLSASAVNPGDTVVRKGEVCVERPSMVLPPNIPQLEGFDIGDPDESFAEEAVMSFLLVRGIRLPSMKYNNSTASLDIFEGELQKAVEKYHNQMQRQENVTTGLIVGPEDCWAFSLLIFICAQVAKNAEKDVERLLDEYRRKKGDE